MEPNERRMTMQQVAEVMGEVYAVSLAALVMTLHRQLGLSVAAVQADLLGQQVVHSDPLVAAIAEKTLAALRHALSLAEARGGRPLS